MTWLPAISSTALLALVLWLLRNLILERLKNSVRFEFDSEIEIIKGDLKKSEELFKSELKIKESEIDALRNGALSSLVIRQTELYKYKLNAVEKLWSGVVELAPARNVSSWMSMINFDIAIKEVSNNPQGRKMFAMFEDGINLKDMNIKEATLARPFLSPLVWALFSAYRSIVFSAVIRMQSLKSGLDKDYTDIEMVTKLVKEALPEYQSYIEKHGFNSFHYLLDILETKILDELNKILNGEDFDAENIEKASRILQVSEKLMESNNKLNNEQP